MPKLSFKTHITQTLTIGTPLMLGYAGHMAVNLADNLMIARLGATELAASSFGHNIFIIFFVFGFGFSSGLTPLVAQNDKDHARPLAGIYLTNALWVNTAISLLFIILLVGFLPFFYLLNPPEGTLHTAQKFFFWQTLSLLPFMVGMCFKNFSEGLSDTRTPMVFTVIINLVNIALNYLLIFGKFGFPAWGAEGAAIATFISRLLFLVFMYLAVVYNPAPRFKAALQGFTFKPGLLHTVRVVKLSMPIAAQMVAEVALFALAAIMVGWLGAKPLAAHQVAITIVSFSFMVSVGLSSAVTIRVGNFYGRHQPNEIKNAAYAGFVLVSAVMFIFGLVLCFFDAALANLFIVDAAVVAIVVQLLVVAVVFQLFDGAQLLWISALRGVNDVKIPAMVVTGAYVGIALPLCYLLAFTFNLGTQGVWIGFLVGLVMAALGHYFRFTYKVKKLNFG